MEKQLFELEPIINKDTGYYSIKGFDGVKAVCNNFINERKFIACETAEDYKSLKKSRTEIRKAIDNIKNFRIAANNLVLGDFNKQSKELEAALEAADAELKKLKDKYDTEHPKEPKVSNEPAIIKVICSTLDAEVAEKVKAYAEKLKCKVEVK